MSQRSPYHSKGVQSHTCVMLFSTAATSFCWQYPAVSFSVEPAKAVR